METINFGRTLIPTILFAIALYLGIVKRDDNFKVSLSRTIWSGIGIAAGLFITVRELITTHNELNIQEAIFYGIGIIILGWGIYAFNTAPSYMPLWRKSLKIITYFFISQTTLLSFGTFYYNPVTQSYQFDATMQSISFTFTLLLIIGLIFITRPDRKKIEKEVLSLD